MCDITYRTNKSIRPTLFTSVKPNLQSMPRNVKFNLAPRKITLCTAVSHVTDVGATLDSFSDTQISCSLRTNYRVAAVPFNRYLSIECTNAFNYHSDIFFWLHDGILVFLIVKFSLKFFLSPKIISYFLYYPIKC